MKITVTYTLECGSKKMTRTAQAWIDDGAVVSNELAESLWKTAKNHPTFTFENEVKETCQPS